MEGAYDGEIATADAEVGRLLAYLDAHGALANTVVIVVGDHGESLGEHREQQHGFFVYDASTQIPLIVAGPGFQSRVVRSQVRIVDVMPTALELLGVQTPATVQGASLVPLARGEPRTLPALVETWYPRYHYGWSELSALRNGRYKFIAAPRPELYDTDADPGETHDLSSANPRVAKAMANALRELEAKYAGTSAPQTPRPVDAAVEQQLRALGYVSSSVSRTVLETRPRGDPKDKIELYNLLKLAGQDSVSGRIADGLAKVQQVLAADPEVIEAYTMLGNMHTKAGRREEAIDAYRRALAVDPEHEGAAWSLALAYKNAGRLADAQSGFERVLQLDARSTKAMWQLADIWMRRGEFARAERVLQQALALDVERAPFLVKLGESHMLRRGAMLHLDAVVLGSGNDARKGSRRSDFFIYHMDDGQALGQQDALGQWDFARFLLEQIHPDPDDVRPRPSDDDWVRRWYRTLLAYQLSQMHFNVADAERGLELFPSDPEILFLEGVLHEALSSPAIQEPLRNSEQTRQSALVRSAGGELDLAEDLLRRAVKRDPTFVEARLHLGRVLVERNNHKAALPELTQVLSKIQDRILQYYGQMFLGRSAAGIGDMAGARAAFERASQLVPAAQSPPLALSQLAYARGDTDEATALLQRLAELPSLERDDPWWFYNTTAGRFFAPSHQEIAADLRKEMPQ